MLRCLLAWLNVFRGTLPCSFLLLGFFLSLMLGCASERKFRYEHPGRSDLLLESLDVSGNTVFSDSEILSKIISYEDPGWRATVKDFPIFGAEHSYYNPMTWEQDKIRLITMYKAFGYYNARIAEVRMDQTDEGDAVRIAIRIEEGPATTIRNVQIGGMEDVEVSHQEILDEIGLELGDTFVEKTYLNAKDTLALALRSRGYAYATVRGTVYVQPKLNQADVFLYVDLGPKCQFGSVRIEGLEDIEASYVEEAVTFEEGDQYSPITMRETQARIYDLGVFSVVKVALESELTEEPRSAATPPKTTSENAPPGSPASRRDDIGEDADIVSALLDSAQEKASARTALSTRVPIVIRVREAKPLSIRVGAGFGVEPQRASVNLRVDWTHRNLFGGLRRIEHFNQIGYAWADTKSALLPNFIDPSNQGWTVSSEIRFTQPQFLERFLSFNANISFKREIEPNWTLMSPSFQLGLRRVWFGHLRTDISYNASLTFLSDLKMKDLSTRPPTAYILEYLEQRVTLDYLDNVINPKEGILLEATVQEATSYFGRIPKIPGGDFDYLYASLSTHAYIPYTLGIEQVLAFRALIGSIYTFGRAKLAPLPQRLYAGGAGSLRSFGQNRFAIYSSDSYGVYPMGGFTKAELSIEPRFMIARNLLGIGDLWGALYADASTILPGQFLFDTDANKKSCANPKGCVETFASVAKSLEYGVGGGVWWLTPIGPVRLDFAYTVSDFKKDTRFRECAGITDTRGYCFTQTWVAPEKDRISRSLNRWSIYIGIGHTF